MLPKLPVSVMDALSGPGLPPHPDATIHLPLSRGAVVDEVCGLSFAIGVPVRHQRLLDAPPWRAPDGDWVFHPCALADGTPFQIGQARAGDEGVEGVLCVDTAEHGARIVAAFAEAFGVDVPVLGAPGAPRPVRATVIIEGVMLRRYPNASFARTDGEGAWTASKWTFGGDTEASAEIYLNLCGQDRVGEWSEKRPSGDGRIAALWAAGLHDGRHLA